MVVITVSSRWQSFDRFISSSHIRVWRTWPPPQPCDGCAWYVLPPLHPPPRTPWARHCSPPARRAFCQLLEANGVFACMWFVWNRVCVCVCVFLRSQFFFVSLTRLPGVHHPLPPPLQPWVSYCEYALLPRRVDGSGVSLDIDWSATISTAWLSAVSVRSFLRDGSPPQRHLLFSPFLSLSLARTCIHTHTSARALSLSLSLSLLQ